MSISLLLSCTDSSAKIVTFCSGQDLSLCMITDAIVTRYKLDDSEGPVFKETEKMTSKLPSTRRLATGKGFSGPQEKQFCTSYGTAR